MKQELEQVHIATASLYKYAAALDLDLPDLSADKVLASLNLHKWDACCKLVNKLSISALKLCQSIFTVSRSCIVGYDFASKVRSDLPNRPIKLIVLLDFPCLSTHELKRCSRIFFSLLPDSFFLLVLLLVVEDEGVLTSFVGKDYIITFKELIEDRVLLPGLAS